MQPKHLQLAPRLQLLADLVPQGARLADIGTDHGYLPVWLLQQGRISSAIAADIGAGPLEHARRTAREYDVYGLAFRLCDGLSAIAPDEADTLVIAGMGGETIIHILESAPWTRRLPRFCCSRRRRSSCCVRWLREHGYAADAERLVEDKGKLYLVLSVRGAEPGTASVLEQYGGFCLEGDPLYGAYLTRQIARLRRRAEGIRESRGEGRRRSCPLRRSWRKRRRYGSMAAVREIEQFLYTVGTARSSRRAGTTWVCSSATRRPRGHAGSRRARRDAGRRGRGGAARRGADRGTPPGHERPLARAADADAPATIRGSAGC